MLRASCSVPPAPSPCSCVSCTVSFVKYLHNSLYFEVHQVCILLTFLFSLHVDFLVSYTFFFLSTNNTILSTIYPILFLPVPRHGAYRVRAGPPLLRRLWVLHVSRVVREASSAVGGAYITPPRDTHAGLLESDACWGRGCCTCNCLMLSSHLAEIS